MEQNQKIIIKSPVAIEWRIPENRLKRIKDKRGKQLKSDVFNASNIPGLQYFIVISPKENTEDLLGQTWIYFHLEYEDELKIDANISISVESANYLSKENYVFEESDGWGDVCCTTDEFFDPEKRYIVDGKMIIKLEGTLTTEKEMPKKSDTIINHSDVLCLGLWNQENKDFTIIVDEKQVAAHKCVLATLSPVFARMFESGMKEAEENKVEIKDFPFKIVEAAIKLCYHHSLVPYATLNDKMILLQFYDKYNIQPLKDDLEAELISEIDESNVCLLTNCSLLSDALKLKEKCAEFLRRCLKKKPICDIDILDKDFASNLFKNAFYHVSE